VVAARGSQQAGRGSFGVGRADRGGGQIGRVGLNRPRHLIRRGDTVGEHVMHLVDDRDATTLQSRGDVHLPERPVARQRCARDLADHAVQLAAAARRRHLDAAQVVVVVDLRVLAPHRVVQLERDVDELIAKRREQVQSLHRHPAEQVEGELLAHVRGVDDAHFERVHVDLGRLGVEQECIDTAQSSHATSVPAAHPRHTRSRTIR
jgi:hypothetical protein